MRVFPGGGRSAAFGFGVATSDPSASGWRGRGFLGVGMAAVVSVLVLITPLKAAADAALPDHRGYEQASPVEKNGLSILSERSLFQASPGGEGVVFFTQSPLPGTEGIGTVAPSLANRSVGGWATQGLSVPNIYGREAKVVGWSEDLGMDYVVAADPGNGSNFFQRNTKTRAVTLIAHSPSEFRLRSLSASATTPNADKLLFETRQQIDPEASEETNVYLWDATDESVHLVSAPNTGESAFEIASAGPYGLLASDLMAEALVSNTKYQPGVLSADGSDAYFSAGFSQPQLYYRRNIEAPASAMTPGGVCEELSKACTIKVSASQASNADPNGEKGAVFLAASADGPPVVFFASKGRLTDDATTGPTDEGADMYRFDIGTGELSDLTASEESPSEPNGAEFRGILGTSRSGNRVYFVANGLLGDAATRGASPGRCPLPGATEDLVTVDECNLYLWEEGAGIRYITRLKIGEGQERTDESDWMPGPGGSSFLYGKTARVSADGAVAVFRSQNPLTSGSAAGAVEFYRFSAQTGKVDCLTCAEPGSTQMYSPTLSTNYTFFATEARLTEPRNLSTDGGRFFFESSDRLSQQDENGILSCPPEPGKPMKGSRCQDVYEWEEPGDGTCTESSPSFHPQNGGCVFLISTGRSDLASYFGDADAAGEDVFFLTKDHLVLQDRDELYDAYDARVGGGLVAQNPPPAPVCLGVDACGRSSAPGRVESPLGSLETGAASGQTKRIVCRAGTRRTKKHGKPACVKKRAKKKKAPKGARKSHGKNTTTRRASK
jgi:hypothetical protein